MEVIPMISDHGDLPWADNHSSSSDDNSSLMLTHSPVWVNQSTIATMTRLETGQLSPISTELELSAVDTHIPGMVPSSTSSTTDGWSTSYSDGGDMDEPNHDVHWDHSSDEMLAVPKLEPTEDDDFHMDQLKEAPRTPKPAAAVPSQQGQKPKRPRGRPRKHPLTPHVASNKVAKGRSKTGCITCRKRKKKCDEAKPRCMNCEKNAVVCEGYNEKTIWKSGKERAEEARHKTHTLPVITLPPIFQGVETPEDMVFLNHYINQLSGVLTVEGQHKNAFKDMLLQMAVEHRGLMHSILCLASSHIDYETPYGARILESNPKITRESLAARAEFHQDAAMAKFHEDINQERNTEAATQKVNLCVRYGQMLCMLLKSIAQGTANGEHRLHLQAYKQLIQTSPPDDSAFLIFITEFFQYYVYADELLLYPGSSPRLALEDWEPWIPIQPVRLIGVADGLFKYLSQISTIRNTIRTNMLNNVDPVVDYTSLFRAAEIDAAIREWTPRWPPGDSRERVGLLYKQMMWVYLFRTIYPPSTSTPPPPMLGGGAASSSIGISADQFHRPTSPPLSPTSPVHPTNDPLSAGRLGVAPPTSRPESPAPIRYPPHHDARITVAVDESLAILDSIKPSDPCQTLLLVPCLVIGCASFAPSQQNQIRAALRGVRGYTGLRNCDRLLELLEEIWRLMERGEWGLVWDWQAVAQRMGLDFSCA